MEGKSSLSGKLLFIGRQVAALTSESLSGKDVPDLDLPAGILSMTWEKECS